MRPGQQSSHRRLDTILHRVRSKPRQATALLTLLLLASVAFPVQISAQAQPPNRFYGSAQVDGKEQPEGTVVEAYIGNTLCGSGTVATRNDSLIYFVDVLGAGQKPGCAKDGDKISFRIAGLNAKETGTYTTAAATKLDLTATGTPRQVAQPTVLAPGTGGTPAPAPSFTPAPVEVTATPVPADTSTPAPAPPPPAAAPVASATPAPSAAVTATPPSSATPPRPTATASATSTPAPAVSETPRSSGGSPALIVAVVLGLIAVATGVGVWFYQRRTPR